MNKKETVLLMGAVLSGIVTLIGAFDALSSVRLVTIITVIAGAFGCGATLVSAIYNYKQRKKEAEH